MEQDASRGMGRWLQSRFVLGTARKIYLVLACLSLVIAMLALVVALVLQFWGFIPRSHVPIPDARAPQPVAMDTTTVAKSLTPPTNLRFVARRITGPLDAGDFVGYLEADTPNGLAAFPNDFDIFGGPDAGQFERTAVSVRYPTRVVLRAGLRPSAALLAKINQELETPGQMQSSYSVIVIARDRFGNVTKPTTLNFALAFGVAPTNAGEAGTDEVSELQRLARTIALHLDPAKTPVYFDQYRRALRVPRECGTTDDNADFIQGFRSAYDTLTPRLTTDNIDAFYAGVCAAWEEGASKEAAAQLASDTARNEAMAKEMASRATHALGQAGISIVKNTSYGIVVSAVMAFLFISLFLAFLAIENHSDALRQAVQALADRTKD
jgi:hypothetical protein